jgi:hypothetical protein
MKWALRPLPGPRTSSPACSSLSGCPRAPVYVKPGKGCMITGCVAVMVGQPVTGDRRRHAHAGPDICQHAPPVRFLILGPSPGRGHGVPAQRPYVLIPDEQGSGTSQAVRGRVQGLFDLRNFTSTRLVDKGRLVSEGTLDGLARPSSY